MGSTVAIRVEESLAEFRFELLPPRLKELWAKTPDNFKSMSEPALRVELRNSCGPMQKDFSLLTRVRIVFWDEYERAARAQESMNAHNLFLGVCRTNIYYGLFDKYPGLLAWVICPLAGYLLQRKELEFLAEERMVEVLSASVLLDNGRVDSRLAKAQIELYQILQDRIYGAVTQKISSEQKNLNLTMTGEMTPEMSHKTISLITNVEELDRRIKEIQKKRESLQTISEPIEINQQKLMLEVESDE